MKGAGCICGPDFICADESGVMAGRVCKDSGALGNLLGSSCVCVASLCCGVMYVTAGIMGPGCSWRQSV